MSMIRIFMYNYNSAYFLYLPVLAQLKHYSDYPLD